MPAFVPPPLPVQPKRKTEPSREDVAAVLAIVRGLAKELPGGAVAWGSALDLARTNRDLSQDLAEQALERLMEAGELYEPTLGTIRLTEVPA